MTHAPAEQAAEVAGENEADARHSADPAHQGDESGEKAEIRAVDAADPLVGIASQRELGGQVRGDEGPQREHRAGQQQRPHERCTCGEVARAETGEDGGGRADRGEPDRERRKRPDGAVESLCIAELSELGVLGVGRGRYLRGGGGCDVGHGFLQRRWGVRCSQKTPIRRSAEIPVSDVLITSLYEPGALSASKENAGDRLTLSERLSGSRLSPTPPPEETDQL